MNSSNAFRIRRFLFRSYSFGIETLGPNSDLPSIASLVINLKGVEQQLRSLIEDKAAGPGQLYPWLLKMAATEIAPILTDIFQTSIREEKSQKLWREANISYIFKKGNKSDPENYRPISLNCVTCKILEHIIHRQTWVTLFWLTANMASGQSGPLKHNCWPRFMT